MTPADVAKPATPADDHAGLEARPVSPESITEAPVDSHQETRDDPPQEVLPEARTDGHGTSVTDYANPSGTLAAPDAAAMPTIDEHKALPAGHLNGKQSLGTMSPPGTSGGILSTQTSMATLVAPVVQDGHGMSTNASALTLIPPGTAISTTTAVPVAEAPVVTEKAAAVPAWPVLAAPALPVGPPPAKEKRKNPFGVDEATKTKFKDFWRIFSFSTTKDRIILGVSVVAAICTGVTMPLMNVIFGRVFGSFSGRDDQGNPVLLTMDKFMQEIVGLVFYLIYLFIARLVLDYIAFLGFRTCSLRISAAMRLEYMRCLFAQSVSQMDLYPPGQAAAMITSTANMVQAGISEKLAQFLSSVSLMISAMVISFYYSWNLTLVTGSGMVLIIIVYATTTPFIVRIMNRVQDAEIKAATVSTEIFTSIRMVAACGAEDKMQTRYMEWVTEAKKRGRRMPPWTSFQTSITFFAIFGTFALAFWYSLTEFTKGHVNSSTSLVVVIFSVMMMTTSIQGITTPLQAAARSASAATIFYIVLDMPKRKTGTLKAPEITADQDIILTAVNFAYPSRPDLKILDNLTLRFPAGKNTAIVGPSGSGKSTIVQLIERWYELDGDLATNPLVLFLRNGWITTGWGGMTPLKDIDVKWWRSQIGLVQQEPFLFNDTISKNVEHGLIGTEWEDADDDVRAALVKKACEEAFADEFITRLPEGYDTPVGDAGIKLSGGQRQRIAIARAIVKQPKILILDEATSAIDVRGEQMVQAALDRAAANRTTITIAHRLSTIRKADNIVVLRQGRAVEQGTHEQLMAREGGAYRALAGAQLLRTDDDDDDDEGGAGAGAAKGKGDEAVVLETHAELGEKEKGKDSAEVIYTEESAFGGDSATLAVAQEGVKKDRGLIGSFGMLLKEQKKQWPWYVMLTLGALGGGAAAPIQAYLFAMLVSLFSFFGALDWLAVLTNFWCLMFTFLAIGAGVAYFMIAWSSSKMSFNITHHYRGEYISSILAKPISFYDHEDHSVGALTARLATDPLQLQQLLGMNMAFVVISFFNVVGCLIISFLFGWKLTAVTALTSIPIIMISAFFRVRYERQFEVMANKVFSESAKFATESIGAFRTVSSLTLENAICDRYSRLLQNHIRAAFWKNSASTSIYALSDSISLPCMAFVLWYGSKLMAEGEYWSFQFVIVYIAVLQGGLGAGQWLSFAPNMAQASVAANRIIDLRRKENTDGRLVSLDVGDLGNDDGGIAVEFRNVWFRYPTRDVPILNGLSFNIQKGQFAAFVGASGSGKTTVISLLERFYRVNAGRILVNGLDASDLSLAPYRRDLSLVAQEPMLFDGTLRANVLLGVDESAADYDAEAALHQACRDAGIHDFIISLPEGYDTEVGLRGVSLSGGQKQRLSIARALIRSPRLLLLDEATSNLDSETERQVQEVFERTRASRTMVVVAHRLATIQNADVIFVMGDGRVLEKGTHDSLLKKRGVYWNMCQAQALDK